MKIAVLGAGAMGSLYGGLLAEAGNEVWLIDVFKEHVDAINKDGLWIEGLSGNRAIKNIKATADSKEVGNVQLVLVFVKSTITDVAISQNKALIGKDTIILTLQNGLGNIEKIQRVIEYANIIAGTTAHGSTLMGPGKIKHAGKGKTIIGELDGSKTQRIQLVIKILEEAGIEAIVSDNIMGLIWDKLLVNVGINALTAITGLNNGQLTEFPETKWILEEAVKEAVKVADSKRIKLSTEDAVEHTKEVCKATAANRSSMLQDVMNHRKTEIEMINGAIVREAEKEQIQTPINKVLTQLVLVKEKTYNI